MGNKINKSLCGIIIIAAITSITRVDAQKGVEEKSGSTPLLHDSVSNLQSLDDPMLNGAEKGSAFPRSGGFCGPECLRCEDTGCIKCREVIVYGTRQCETSCPIGYRETWSTLVDYMGRLCTESGGWNSWLSGFGMGRRGLAILVGAVSGAAICLVLLLAGCGWVVYNRGKSRGNTTSPMCSVYDEALVNPRNRDTEQWLSPQEMQERREFVKQVAALRPDAPVFLAMLNDTRRKVRQLYRPNGTDSRSKAYRTVLRDLSRLLTLLNKPEERLGVPPYDWSKLFAWAERSLRRYKKSSGSSCEGGSAGSACSSGGGSSASSTPSSSHALNQPHLNRVPPDVHHTHSILQLPLPPDCGIRDSMQGEGIEVPALLQTTTEWSQTALVNGLYYDSFYPLGLRPQDEITTEL